MESAQSPAAHAASSRRHPGVTRHALPPSIAAASLPGPTAPLVPAAINGAQSRRSARFSRRYGPLVDQRDQLSAPPCALRAKARDANQTHRNAQSP
jgi:hypothetical protein